MERSHNCNDFIIKDNEFIRDFEGMYANHSDPWNQSENYSKDITEFNL